MHLKPFMGLQCRYIPFHRPYGCITLLDNAGTLHSQPNHRLLRGKHSHWRHPTSADLALTEKLTILRFLILHRPISFGCQLATAFLGFSAFCWNCTLQQPEKVHCGKASKRTALGEGGKKKHGQLIGLF